MNIMYMCYLLREVVSTHVAILSHMKRYDCILGVPGNGSPCGEEVLNNYVDICPLLLVIAPIVLASSCSSLPK